MVGTSPGSPSLADSRRGPVRLAALAPPCAPITTGNALFIASQFMPAFAGAALIALVALQGLLSAPRTRRKWRPFTDSVSRLNVERTLLIVAACLTVYVIQSIFLPHHLKPLTAAHLLIYLAIVFGGKSLAPSWPNLSLIKISVWGNAILLLTYYAPPLRDTFWYENLGQFRYRSIYFEPSIAALMLVLNITVIWSCATRVRYASLLIAVSLLCLALTYSGSGILVLAAMMFTSFSRPHLRTMLKLALASGLLLGAWIASPTGSDAIQELLISRLSGIIALEYDNSVHLRAVAPFLFLADLMDSPWTAILGAGIGGIEAFIMANEASFWYLTDFSGEQLTAINNGYVVIIALVGIPLAALAFLAASVWLWRSRAPRSLKAFLLLYPFVSGFVIHPLLWLLVVMVGVKSSSAVDGRRPSKALP